MEKILILGGTRYLGRLIAKQLLKEQFQIATLSRSQHAVGVKHFICDRKDTAELGKIFRYFNPNIILDMVNFDQSDAKGITSLHEQGCLKNLNHYIMISSFFVYNYFDYQIFSEKKLDRNYDQANIDGYTKRKIESEMTLYDSTLMAITTMLRLPFVFSADDYSNRFQNLCKFVLANHKPIVKDSFKYSLLRKQDAAEAIIKVINSNPMGISDLSNSGCVTNQKLIDELKIVLISVQGDSILEEDSLPYSVNRNICLSSKKLTIELPVSDALRVEAESWLLNRQQYN
jgi:nucleoside-diphosphate-sugar epimerase